MAKNKYYKIDEVTTLLETFNNKIETFTTLKNEFHALAGSIFGIEEYREITGGGFQAEEPTVPESVSQYDRFFEHLNKIIAIDADERVPLTKDLDSNNQVAESYFQRVQYVSDSITEDPKSLFTPPSGGGWADYMFNYNMNMLNLDNTDVEAAMEIMDYYYTKYLENCKGIPSIDGFYRYMQESPDFEVYTKVMNVLVSRRLGFDVNNTTQMSDTELKDKLICYLIKSGMTNDEIQRNIDEGMTTLDLLDLAKSLEYRNIASSLILSNSTGIDSSVIYNDTVYQFDQWSQGIGTVSTINYRTAACETFGNQQDYSTSSNLGGIGREVYNYSPSKDGTISEFVKQCESKNGFISYESVSDEYVVLSGAFLGVGNKDGALYGTYGTRDPIYEIDNYNENQYYNAVYENYKSSAEELSAARFEFLKLETEYTLEVIAEASFDSLKYTINKIPVAYDIYIVLERYHNAVVDYDAKKAILKDTVELIEKSNDGYSTLIIKNGEIQ